MTSFVTGAGGFLGRHLVNALVECGEDVKVLLRHPRSISFGESPSVIEIEGDITDPNFHLYDLEGVEVFYHLAGVVTDWAPHSLYKEVHVGGTRNVIEAAIKHGVKRFVYISTVDVVDYDHSSPVDELTPYTNSKTGYRSSKVLAEKMLADYVEKGLIEVVIIRPVWIYGVGDRIFIPEIAYQMSQNSMFYIGSSKNNTQLVHVKNLSDAIISAGKKDGINGQSFLISDKEIVWSDLITFISKRLDLRNRILTLPYRLSHGLGWMMEVIFKYLKQRPPLTRTSVETIGHDITISSDKAKEVLGYEPKIAFEDGIVEVLNWIHEEGSENIRKT